MSNLFLAASLVSIFAIWIGAYIAYLLHLIRDAERERDEWRALALATSRKMDESNLRWVSEWSLMVPCVTALRGMVATYESGEMKPAPVVQAKRALKALEDAKKTKEIDSGAIERVHKLFLEKLAAEEPSHPWLKRREG